MRPFCIGPVAILMVLLAAACAAPTPPMLAPAAPSPSAQAGAVNPANIKRIGRELPPGYEVTGVPSAASPRVVWGLGADPADVAAKPPQCLTLADPGDGRDPSAQGVSASGAGGIVDAVVVAVRSGPVGLDSNIVAACGRWTLTAGPATASVSLGDAPRIDGAETLGMVADVATSVESGTEIGSRVYTFIAYLDDHYAFTTLTTDPGSVAPPLASQFAADLLVKTVSTLRS
ncbi:DUF5642 family protein [Mycobacterium decipiens]|uniref:DUF5642 domain-containing protein n=1 Tax=Mycobacterium decipiens TaxID=1430326 RepID=A0A1X2LVH5_9MYCO|nr:DUF5642 family protein [Mycobacterium decipiens]OSC40965.1 hypothetical protein B8W66_10935 [Mycobacterium decipiens]